MPTKERDAGERERCVTGIDAIDHILNGGIPRGNTVLISGSVGTGKTSMCIEFLIRGALEGENSLYLSVTEPTDKLLMNVIPFDFFDDKLAKQGKLQFVDLPKIYQERGSALLRTLQIVKMRGTTHSRAKYVLDLTTSGVLLVPLLKGGSVTGGG